MYYMQLGKLLSSAHARHTDIHTVRISHQKTSLKQIETSEYTESTPSVLDCEPPAEPH